MLGAVVGADNGVLLGLRLGFLMGIAVGSFEGENDVNLFGLLEGEKVISLFLLGLKVGDNVNLVGEVEGDFNGTDGEMLGLALGLGVGLTDGEFDGDRKGDFVGLSDGELEGDLVNEC